MRLFFNYIYYLSCSCTIYSVHSPFAYNLLKYVFAKKNTLLKGKEVFKKHILTYPDTKIVSKNEIEKLFETSQNKQEGNQTIYVFEHPHNDDMFCQQIIDNKCVSQSIDIYCFLFFTFNDKLSKEHFIVRPL